MRYSMTPPAPFGTRGRIPRSVRWNRPGRRALLVFLFVLVLSGVCRVDAAPRLVIEGPSEDIGEVWEGRKITRVYRVLNTGDQALEVTRVEPSCGCTEAFFDRTIPPGEEGEIRLEIDTRGLKGTTQERATVYANDPERPESVLVLRAVIKPVILLSERFIPFSGKVGETITRHIDITAKKDEALSLSPLSFSLEGSVTFWIEEVERGKRFKLYFRNLPNGTKKYRGYLKVGTNYAELPEFTIWIRGNFT